MTVTLHEGEHDYIGKDWGLQVLRSVYKDKRFIDVVLGDAGIKVEGWRKELDIVGNRSNDLLYKCETRVLEPVVDHKCWGAHLKASILALF